MNWYTAKSLTVLLKQINELYPKRNKASDGTIGDTLHANRISDHNPDANGRVNALDITYDPVNGPDLNWLAARLILDERTNYVIYNHRIWQAGKWLAYTGTDPHTNHLHLSVKPAKADITTPWALKEEDMYQNKTAEEWAKRAESAEAFKQAVVNSLVWEGDANMRIEKLPLVLNDLQQFKKDALKSAQEESEDAELGRKVRELVKE